MGDAARAAGITFGPLAVETLGGWTESSIRKIRNLAWDGHDVRKLTKRYPCCAGGGAVARSPGLRSLYSGLCPVY